MKFTLIDLHPAAENLQKVVKTSMNRKPRQLPAWMLYDAVGSQLFKAICEQPEYTLTRTEIELIELNAEAMANSVGDGVLVEFGIGNTNKVDPLLKSMQPSAFLALDISYSALKHSLNRLSNKHQNTQFIGICCDHSQLDFIPKNPHLDGKKLIGFFPGSSLGNFSDSEAIKLLQRFRSLLNGGPLLLGVDQPRDPAIMEAAYNDAAGVSEAFALNLLQRLNRDLQGDIKNDSFYYRVRWESKENRIEMALISKCEQKVTLAGEKWTFKKGETWITEHSVKYSPEATAILANQAGWNIKMRWHDSKEHVSIHLLVPKNNPNTNTK